MRAGFFAPRLFYIVLLAMLLPGSAICAGTLRIEGFAESMGWTPGDTVVVIKAEVTEIPERAFAQCVDLRAVIFEEESNLKRVGDYAFWECESLESIDLPEGTEVIGNSAFRQCDSLRKVTLPSSLRDIKQFAFIYCEKLSGLKLPPRLEHIGNNAFSRCVSITEVYIPDTVREVESYAFSDCFSLLQARLAGNDALLGELIFSGCRNLRKLIVPSVSVPGFDCESFIFEPQDIEAYRRCTLVVPCGSEGIYRKAAGWCLFRRVSCQKATEEAAATLRESTPFCMGIQTV